jgi:hypothetical protein
LLLLLLAFAFAADADVAAAAYGNGGCAQSLDRLLGLLDLDLVETAPQCPEKLRMGQTRRAVL